jgi:hypothetical protein
MTPYSILSNHTTVANSDDLLRKFWKSEENTSDHANFSPEERAIMKQFEQHHSHTIDGRFVVPLPKKPHSKEASFQANWGVSLPSCKEVQVSREIPACQRIVEQLQCRDGRVLHAELVPAADLNQGI